MWPSLGRKTGGGAPGGREGKRGGNFHGQVDGGFGGQRAVFEAMFDSRAGKKLHGDEGVAVLFADLENRADIRVIEGGGSQGVSFEARESAGIGGVGREKFQGDDAVRARVFGLIDDTRGAAA